MLTTIRECSDLHLEAAGFVVPPMEGDSDSVLVLSGDIMTAYGMDKDGLEFFQHVSRRFMHVIYIPGNHEYYRSNINKADNDIRAWLKTNGFNNVHFLNKESIILDGTAYIGATLWTDMRGGNPVAANMVQRVLYDYKVIEIDGDDGKPRKLLANDTMKLHAEHKEFILSEIAKHKAAGLNTVVISHHAPSQLSTHPRWRGDPINPGFSNDMDEDVLKAEPDIWFHGHMHDTFEYMVGKTLVACNPRGYAKGIWPKYKELYARDSITPEEFKQYWLNENEEFNPFYRVTV